MATQAASALGAPATQTTEFFTRGKPGEPDNRGPSLAAKHLEKLQAEKEERAMEKLGALMPQMGATVRALALAEVGWDVDAALGTLRSFQVAYLDKLNALAKVNVRFVFMQLCGSCRSLCRLHLASAPCSPNGLLFGNCLSQRNTYPDFEGLAASGSSISAALGDAWTVPMPWNCSGIAAGWVNWTAWLVGN
jgi:hypothetical protein